MRCFSGLLSSVSKSSVSRWLWLTGSGLLLLAALLVAWTWRFKAVPGQAEVTLKDLKSLCPERPGVTWAGTDEDPVLRLSKTQNQASISLHVPMQSIGTVDALHLGYQLRAVDLIMGPRVWMRGRLAIDWIEKGNTGRAQYHPIHDIDGNDASQVASRVVVPARQPAAVLLVFENHATSGTFEISNLKLTPVVERGWWKWASHSGMILGLLGLLVFTKTLTRCCWISAAAATLISAVLLGSLILPQVSDVRPQWWGMVYHLSPNAAPQPKDPATQAPAPSPADPTPPKPSAPIATDPPSVSPSPTTAQPAAPLSVHMVQKDRQIGKFWRAIKLPKPLIHFIGFAMVALVLSGLIGPRPAVVIAGFFAIGSEVIQWITGYPFQRSDAIELLMNVIGIGVGVGGFAAGLKGIRYWGGASRQVKG